MPASGTGTGLTAQYFNSIDLNAASLALTRVDPTVNFNWGNGSPDSKVSSDNFSARWTGSVQALTTEAYTFATTSDDGIRLWVNGQRIVDAWSDHGPTTDTGTINLVAGQRYDVKLEYYERGGQALNQLSWATPTIAKQIVPQSQLYSSAAGGSGGSGTATYLSDLNPLSSTSGYGPVEKDRSNGENAAGDGHRLILNGVGYDKGLGVHSYSEISYALNGATRFQSVVGVDDEVGNNGQVDFQVFADGVKLYDSGNVRGVDAGKTIDISTAGHSTLTLKVLDGGDGPSYDHADWADARLLFGSSGSTPPPAPTSGLTVQYFNSQDLNPSTLVSTSTVPNISFDWGQASPASGVTTDHWSARYTGNFTVNTAGNYTFATVADDGTRLWIDGQQVISDWRGHGVEQHEGTISLSPGSHSLKLEYFDDTWTASLKLEGSGPGFGNQTLPASFFTSTGLTLPPTGGGGSGGSIDLAAHDSDLGVGNAAYPDGVPSYYSWYKDAAQPGWGNNPRTDWNAVTAWGQVYESEGHHPEESPNTRVQLRADQLWILSKSTGRWTRVQNPGVEGGAFNSDFGNNGGTGVTTKDESSNGGGLSVTAGNGYNFHFWPGARGTMNPSDIGAVYTVFQARLVLDNPNGPDDRGQSHYIASGGADYWRSTDAPFASDWSNNGGVGGGRFKTVTNDWQSFSYESISANSLLKNPPPVTLT